jgi:hypothetical protein
MIETVFCEKKGTGLEHWVGKASDEKKFEIKVPAGILAKYVGAYVEQLRLWEGPEPMRERGVSRPRCWPTERRQGQRVQECDPVSKFT